MKRAVSGYNLDKMSFSTKFVFPQIYDKMEARRINIFLRKNVQIVSLKTYPIEKDFSKVTF